MSNIRFVGHTGELLSLGRLHPKSMFVLDANTVLNLVRHVDQRSRLDEAHMRLLRETRQRVRRQWTERFRFLPVDPVLALMELTRQDIAPDYTAYLARFEHFFVSVYGVDNYDRSWVQLMYEPALRLTGFVHRSISQTLQQVLAAAPGAGGLDRPTILKRIDDFLAWTIQERDNLAMIGGPLLQLAVYAIAGSPEAHRFLKLARVPKEGLEVVARNVAWDLMHWVNLEFHYHRAKYPSTVVCTSDQALADFLLARRNRGPRSGLDAVLHTNAINSYGELTLPKLSRLDQSSLGADIAQRLVLFWQRMGEDPRDDIMFAAFEQ